MKTFELNISNFKPFGEYSITKVCQSNWNSDYRNDIQKLINLFNNEYKWDGMFDIRTVDRRMENNEILFILYYNNISVGYVFFKELDINTIYAYNSYVTKKENRTDDAYMILMSKSCEEMFKSYKTVISDVDDWHKRVIEIITKIGYIEK